MNKMSGNDCPHSRLERLERLMGQDPENALLLADAAETALSLGLLDKAERYTSDELVADPNSPTARFRSASICIAQRRLEEAGAILDLLWNQGHHHPAVLHNRAYVRFLAKDFAGCEAVLNRTMTSGSASLEAPLQVLWLRALHHQDRLPEAWAWASATVAAGNLRLQAYAPASLIALDLGHLPEAKELADEAIRENPLQPEALVARASVALAERSFDVARQLAERALGINTEDGRASLTLGIVELLQGNGQQALQRLEKAVAALPNHAMAWQALGWAAVVAGNLERAKQAFFKAREIDPSDADGAGGISLTLALQNDSAGAQQYLQEAQGLDPANDAARYAQAVLSGDMESLKGAEQVVSGWFGAREA